MLNNININLIRKSPDNALNTISVQLCSEDTNKNIRTGEKFGTDGDDKYVILLIWPNIIF